MTPLELYCGDCREIMASWPEASIDAIVTDPPYELTNRPPDVKACRGCGRVLGGNDGMLVSCPRCGGALENQRSQGGRGFMGKAWDGTGVAFESATWASALRLLKPGGHLVAFGGPRTYHRLACAIEDAGFEIRDCLMWIFGSGFPKSLNLHGEYEGWGTALKPAYEPIVLARKPLIGTVAGNVEAYGAGALNIDGTRIGTEPLTAHGGGINEERLYGGGSGIPTMAAGSNPHVGRWPANVLLDEDAADLLDAQSGQTTGRSHVLRRGATTGAGMGYGSSAAGDVLNATIGDSGGASRFFYTAKASRTEREAMLEDMEPTRRSDGREKDIENPRLRTNARRNDHPTVKPVDLMRWLCRLITPPGGLILDPFMGSGSTGMAALDAGFRFRGIDQDEHYVDLARRRIEGRHVFAAPPEPGPENISPRLL